LSFCYNEFNYFARMNSVILLDILEILSQSFCVNTIIFCYSAQSFHVATVLNYSSCYNARPILVLSHSSLLYCSVIFYCYSAQSFCTATMLNHSSCKRSSIIHYCYSAQPFSTKKYSVVPHCYSAPIIFLCYSAHPFYAAIMLNHSSSKMSSVIHHCYSAQSFLYCKGAQPFLVTTAHGAAQSFCKMTRFGHRHARTGGGSWLGHGGMGPNRMCGATGPSHVHGVRGLVTLARLDRGWLVQVMGLPVHHYR
jgi:hypothetical protein